MCDTTRNVIKGEITYCEIVAKVLYGKTKGLTEINPKCYVLDYMKYQ